MKQQDKITDKIHKLIEPRKMLEQYRKKFMKTTSWEKHKRMYKNKKSSGKRLPSDIIRDAHWYRETMKGAKGTVAEMYRQAMDESTL